MVKLGGTATVSHMEVFQGLEKLFRRQGIDLDWVLYSDYDTMVEAFVKGEIDLAWNGPLSYVKIKRLAADGCRVIAMRDVDINYITHFITRADSGIDTMEDLKDRSFAFGRRSSVQAGLLAYSFLKDSGISPSKDLSANSFYEDRQSETKSDERDVVERVSSGEFDAGAVSQRVLETMAEDGTLARDAVRIFWSSPGYSHCCFTSQSDLDPALAAEIESAFLSVTADDPVGKAVLEGEACDRFVPGTDIGWELIEKAAEAEGLI
ncbi:MAG: phosphate/phosphite/phosphonate ABC transporter substrate-binding protein [Chloroflexi bacterium]|nr:phosphate/phosphite/phosphonate ABC transporter substrate-binding protein [Chloroflexota bacterium]